MSQHAPAELLRRARQGAGLSQAELARRAGVPRSVLCLYESGRRQPSGANLIHLLDVAGFRLRLERVADGVDLERAGRILEQVVELAEAFPFRPRGPLRYPPVRARVR